MKILECSSIRDQELIKLKQNIKENLTLAIIQIGHFEENDLYLRSKRKLAQELNINLLEIVFDETNSKEEIINNITSLNNNPDITGIIIQKPILKEFNYQELVNHIDYKKDIDGVTQKNQNRLKANLPSLIPCTARSVLKVFDYYQIPLINQKITILGKSPLSGLPLYHILLNNNLNVTLCDSKTINTKEIIKSSDIIISTIGKPNYFDNSYFTKDQILIDVGTNYLDGQLVGDIDFNSLDNSISMITPVPGGIGRLTPLYLFINLIEASNLKK